MIEMNISTLRYRIHQTGPIEDNLFDITRNTIQIGYPDCKIVFQSETHARY